MEPVLNTIKGMFYNGFKIMTQLFNFVRLGTHVIVVGAPLKDQYVLMKSG